MRCGRFKLEFLDSLAVRQVKVVAWALPLDIRSQMGFSGGVYYSGSIGSEVGASVSGTVQIQISNCRSVAELAGDSVVIGGSGGEFVVGGLDAVIPLDIGRTGHWAASFDLGIGIGSPLEQHTQYSYTGFICVYE